MRTLLIASPPVQGSDLFSQVLPWVIGLIVALVLATVVIMYIRRQINADDESVVGFTLHDLRQLHARGEMSDEEFEKARDAMIGRVKATLQQDIDDEPEDGAEHGDDDDPATPGTSDSDTDLPGNGST